MLAIGAKFSAGGSQERSPFPTSRKPRPLPASASTQDDCGDDHDGDDDHDGGGDDDDDPSALRRHPSHRRQDRSSGDDVPPLQRWVRFHDLKRAGIIGNWTQLARLIELQNFPPGTMLSPKVRAWTVSEIEEWLATRPVAGKRQDADVAEAR
jgi:Prophage CP4-57 regulatory protein (AlpA)